MIKVGIVVQRYGKEVVGGAETLARDIAERLNAGSFDCTVFTTTAKDYITWADFYEPGETILKGVIVKRYRVERERDMARFNAYSDSFFAQKPENRDETAWIVEQGPYAPALIEALEREQHAFDIFLFFTYLYYPTVEGLKAVDRPAVLFPTAHDEPPIHLELMKGVFKRPDALFFLTGAEMDLVKRLFQPEKRLQLTRTGMNIENGVDENLFREKYLAFLPYILYAGRIERGKGLEMVFDAYRVIKKERLVELVLMGKKLMDIPEEEGIKYVGYVSEAEKLSAFKGAVLSVQPSPLESLSITTLESFSQKTPVLVNRQSEVLMEHINLSNGGLSFTRPGDFLANFLEIYDSRKTRREMGMGGYRYVSHYFSWEGVIKNIRSRLEELVSPPPTRS